MPVDGNAYEYEDDIKVEDLKEPEDKKPSKEDDKAKSAGEEKQELDKEAEGEESNLTDAEQQAYAQGWRPETEWKGDPEKWVSAKEFLFRGELMDRIQKQTKVINDMKSTQDDMANALKVMGEHNSKIAEQEYKRALDTLKKQRREAMHEGEFDRADEIDERIDELKDAKKEADSSPKVEKKDTKDTNDDDTPKGSPEVDAWYAKNDTWYTKDIAMTAVADRVFDTYLAQHQGDFNGALEAVDTLMRERFPEEMGVQKKASPSSAAVSEGSGRAKSSKKSGKSKQFTVKDLNPEQYQVAKTFVDTEVFGSMQEYVDQLADLGELDIQQ